MSVLPLASLLLAAVLLVLPFLVIAIFASRRSGNLPNVAAIASLCTMGFTVVVTLWATMTTLLASQLDVTVSTGELPVNAADGLALDPPPTATILSGGFDQVSVTAEGVGMVARIALAASVVSAGAALLGVAWVVWRLARSMKDHDPFKVGSRALLTVAVIVMAGGLLSSIAGDVGNWAASNDLFAVSGWGSVTTGTAPTDPTDLGWPEPADLSLTIPFWPLAAGLVLGLLAAVFRHGAQLQHDAEGLV